MRAFAAESVAGRGSPVNRHAGYAGPWLLAVVAGQGAEAAAAAVDALRAHDVEPPAGSLVPVLERAVEDVRERLRGPVVHGSGAAGVTLTAVLRAGGRMALAHLGDCRAYLLRESLLFQLTADQTPPCVLGMREDDLRRPSEPIFTLHGADLNRPLITSRTVLPGDRYLLCSAGTAAGADDPFLHEALTAGTPPADAARRVVSRSAERDGSADLVCVVADDTATATAGPVLVGAAETLPE